MTGTHKHWAEASDEATKRMTSRQKAIELDKHAGNLGIPIPLDSDLRRQGTRGSSHGPQQADS